MPPNEGSPFGMGADMPKQVTPLWFYFVFHAEPMSQGENKKITSIYVYYFSIVIHMIQLLFPIVYTFVSSRVPLCMYNCACLT